MTDRIAARFRRFAELEAQGRSPLYAELERMLIATLASHPEALAKVVDGLRQLEQKTPPADIAALSGPLLEHQDAA